VSPREATAVGVPEFLGPGIGEGQGPLERIFQLQPVSLTRGKLGPCGTVTDAEDLHNPVLTLNIRADNSRENGGNHNSSFFFRELHNHRFVLRLPVLPGFRYFPALISLIQLIVASTCD